jgi:hypothetical protein
MQLHYVKYATSLNLLIMNTLSSIAEEKVDVLGKAAMAVRFASLICKGRQNTAQWESPDTAR